MQQNALIFIYEADFVNIKSFHSISVTTLCISEKNEYFVFGSSNTKMFCISQLFSKNLFLRGHRCQ